MNVASQVHVTNTDLPLLFASAAPPRPSVTPLAPSRKPLIEAPGGHPARRVINFNELEDVPKSLYTHYTYYYTIIDGTNTKKSTRAEVVSTTANPALNLAALKVGPTVNSDGFVALGSGPETVHLGKRTFGRATTEVNLAMETLLKLDGISNVIVESVPTAVVDGLNRPTTPLPSGPLIESSFASATAADHISTPEIPDNGISRSVVRTRRPVRISSAAVVRDSGVRSRLNGRPGLRVRVRPGASRVPPVANEIMSSVFDELISPTPTLFSSAEELQPTSVIESAEATAAVDESSDGDLVTPSKKRVAVTVRRPFGGFNRLRTRVRPGTTGTVDDPKIVVVTRSGQAGQNRPLATSRFRVMSRVVKPRPTPSSELIEAISATAAPEHDIRSIVSVNENGETVSLAVTTVPVIVGTDTSYRTVVGRSTLPGPKPSSVIAAAPASSVAHHSPVEPSPVIVTYYTTTTHTIPFTIGDKTLFTTFEITNSRIATEPLPNLFENPITRTTKVSDGVTLIVASSPVAPVTLDPTLITGQPFHMQDDPTSPRPAVDANAVTRTMYTTYTFFTTFYTDDTSSVISSEKVVSNLITLPATDGPAIEPSASTPFGMPAIEPSEAQPVTVVETSERIDTSTIYSTQTYYATLYNGSSSTITPIEDVKTEYVTVREPIIVTRTLSRGDQTRAPQSVFTRTYYTTRTNLVTVHKEEGPVTTTAEETVSNVVTFTVPGFSLATALPDATASPIYIASTPVFTPELDTASLQWLDPDLSTTRSTYTTLTHYITLYSGASTILSTIEEISPTVVTEPVGFRSVFQSGAAAGAKIERTQEAKDTSSRDLMTGFVPSVSTFYMTHTYYTTLHNGASSTISSREEVTSSLVTLYVPQSLATHIQPTASGDHVSPTSVRPFWEELASSAQRERASAKLRDEYESSVISKVISELKASKGLSDEEASQAVFGAAAKSTTVIDGSTLVVLNDLILSPSSARDSAIHPTEAPIDVKSILNEADLSLLSSLVSSRTLASSSVIEPSAGFDSAIQPGSVIELSDLLNGSGQNISGSLGAAIKDIVQLIAANKNKQATTPSEETDRTPEPVYVPVGSTGSGKQPTTARPHELAADLAPVFRPESAPELQPSLAASHPDAKSNIQSSSATPLLPSVRVSASPVVPLNSKAIFSTVDGGATTIFFGDAEDASLPRESDSSVVPTRYVTSVESMTRTLTLTTTKVYYTRDSPLTITSVLTTVIPPKTFVSTIIGSRTILGTATEPTKTLDVAADPSERGEGSTTITTTTLIFNSITTTIVRTLVIPTDGIQPTKPVLRVPVTKTPSSQRTTKRPLTSLRKPTTTTVAPVNIKQNAGTTRKRPAYKPKPPPMPTVPTIGRDKDRVRPPLTDMNTNRGKTPTQRVVPTPILEDDQCTPACNAANKEICVENNGKAKCECRPGFARKEGSYECKG